MICQSPAADTLAASAGASSRQGGFTLLELAIYMALVGILSVPLLAATVGVNRASAEGNQLTRTLERNRVAIHRMAEDFEASLEGTLWVSTGGQVLTFVLNGGFDGTGPTFGPTVTYWFASDPDDPFNGTDDDGDGYADEVLLVRWDSATAETNTVATTLDFPSSIFAYSGNGLQVTLTTVGTSREADDVMRLSNTMVFFPRS